MFERLLIANRGEIAIRIARAAAGLGIETVGIFSLDDAASLHIRHTDQAHALGGRGARAYLDIEGILRAARETGCDAIHPGYGFLSESAELAARCRQEGLCFVGPSTETLHRLGNKGEARSLAQQCGVPILKGTFAPASLQDAEEFLASLGQGGAMVIKAIAGGGGRGMRLVFGQDEVPQAYDRCRSEATAAFGLGDVYLEEFLPHARHIEVQILGDGSGNVCHYHERECSLQRRHQKIIEIAPSPSLPVGLRDSIHAAAVRMAEELSYHTIGTFEFLAAFGEGGERFVFLEANPRLQVEHTVTEEVFGVDLVQAQLRLAAGCTLDELHSVQPCASEPRGFAIQLRVNAETMSPEGEVVPSGGTLTAFEPPSGPGVRVDTCGYAGYSANMGFDSLLAKVIVHSPAPGFDAAVAKAYRALCEFRLAGIDTNIPLLQSLLQHRKVQDNQVHTRFIDLHAHELVHATGDYHRELFVATGSGSAAGEAARPAVEVPFGMIGMNASLPGIVVAVQVAEGDLVHAGQELVVLEAVKMEHVLKAPQAGVVHRILVAIGDGVIKGQPLIFIEPQGSVELESQAQVEMDLDYVSPKLARVLERQAVILDAGRPEAVQKRHAKGKRTARENLASLCDEGSFGEIGGLAVALRHREHTPDELVRKSPADGVITGFASVNRDLFGEELSRCTVASFDPTVFAGTLGVMGSKKLSRLFRTTRELGLPLIYLGEGGGGRAGNEYESHGVSGIDHQVLVDFAKLRGGAPLIGVTSGYCFGGNANILGMCDIVIATEDSSIGVGGPALIEGTGLGSFRPEDIGPISMQAANGVVDIVVADEAEGVAVARKCLSYFQGSLEQWNCADQRLLRHALPENRLRAYDITQLIANLADADSVLELRAGFAPNTVTALARFEGRPVGILASDCRSNGGAMDPDGSDKASQFLRLCDTFGLPVVFLCDCPGFLIGPDAERQALVRRSGDLLVTLVNLTVPVVAVVLRKAYGVGAAAMLGGSSISNILCVAWPTAEFGHMGPEGNAKLGFQRELAAITDPEEQKAFIQSKVDAMLAHGDPLNTAMFLEVDNVIDPADTRFWVLTALRSGAVN